MPREVNMPEQQENRAKTARIVAPLAEIRLANFKSVIDSTVELRPLSVVVGRNSSGKSTLLQSVLALAQAVRNKSNSSQFPLNGEYVRLGTFGEVLSFGNSSANPEIAIGFSLSADGRLRSSRSGSVVAQRRLISWTGHLTAPEESSNGFATLSAFKFGVSTTNDSILESEVSLDVSSVRGEIDSQGPWPVAVDRRFFTRDRFPLWVDGQIVDLPSGKSSRIDCVTVTGGLPLAAFRQEERFVVYSRQWWDTYNEVLLEAVKEQKSKIRRQTAEAKQLKADLSAIEVAATDFNAVYEYDRDNTRRLEVDDGWLHINGAKSYSQKMFERQSMKLTEKQRGQVAASIASLSEADFNAHLKKELVEQTWINERIQEDIGSEIGIDLWNATRRAEILFRDLQYLGPLRESPQVLYNPGPSRIDLGTNGEYTAAVLHAHQNRSYMVPLPDGSVRSTRLGKALNLWLVKLGLADEAKATDRGRLGIGLTVSPVGSGKDVDLTSVGVGVSQVLPVLILCLLARRGSVVLMEQPELHLHPAMQLRLTDFLLACARSGRQIIIETHSEHLVNRLRLHVAQDETSRTGDLVQLLFAEQDNGVTSYRTSQINPLGGLSEDWPRGFLDVGSDEAGQLLRQTVLRQRQIPSKKD